jgi:hypothetical protein
MIFIFGNFLKKRTIFLTIGLLISFGSSKVSAVEFGSFIDKPDPAVWKAYNQADLILLPDESVMKHFAYPDEPGGAQGNKPQKERWAALPEKFKISKLKISDGKYRAEKPFLNDLVIDDSKYVIDPLGLGKEKVNVSQSALYLSRRPDGNYQIIRIGNTKSDILMMSRTFNCSSLWNPNDRLKKMNEFLQVVIGYQDNFDIFMDQTIERILPLYIDQLIKVKPDFEINDFKGFFIVVQKSDGTLSFGAFINGGNDYSYDELSKDDQYIYFKHYEVSVSQTSPESNQGPQMTWEKKYPLAEK